MCEAIAYARLRSVGDSATSSGQLARRRRRARTNGSDSSGAGEERRGAARPRAARERQQCSGSLLLAHRGEQIAARLLAAAANLRADAAVVMVGRVALALLGASTACDDAGLDRGAYDAEVGLGLAGQDPAVASQTSAQSRLSRMHRTSSGTSGSPRQASAQLVHVAEQSKQSSIQRKSRSRSRLIGRGCRSMISLTVTSSSRVAVAA